MTAKTATRLEEAVSITAPDLRVIRVDLVGTEPLVLNRFSQKAIEEMKAKHMAGSTAKSKRKREAKDFEGLFNGARYISEDGWDGVHAGAFRNAMIRACSLVGFKMTLAKLSIFIVADGYDKIDGTPLIRILGPTPERLEIASRNADGTPDIHPRPMWRKWGMRLSVRFDADQFTASDVVNLINRAGQQVGIGEGRPSSKNSNGMGYGLFRVVEENEVAREKVAA